MRKIILAALFLTSCNGDGQVGKLLPFKAVLIGNKISFPITLGQLLKTTAAKYKTDGQYEDSTMTTRTSWFYDWHTINWDSLGTNNIPRHATIYGVSFTLKNKAHKIDSVKQVIEDQLGIKMKTLEVQHLNLNKEFLYRSEYPVFVTTPSRGVYISLRQASCKKGDYPYICGRWESSLPAASDNPENNLRLAISFGLTPTEEERFALGDGRTWERKD